MVGIVSYGAYIPIYRLSQAEIARAWGGGGGRGERAVANYDEDSITMAVEAAIDCLNGMDRHSVDGLYFASTTPPYGEKQSASIVAAAADLRNDIFTLDLVDSLRSGTSAIRAASDAVKSGSAKKVLVTAADCRLPAPNSEFEPVFGDGSAAFLIGDTDVAATIEGSHSISSDFIDVWKRNEDAYVRTWEDRFVLEHGYSEKLQKVVSELMKKCNLTPKDITKAVYYAPDARSHRNMAKRLGFDPATQVQEPMFDSAGNTGAAFAPIMLVAALEKAKPGDKILLANYGDGADAFLLQVTTQIEKIRDRRGIKRNLESKMSLPNYEKYIRFRDLMEWEAERRGTYISSLPMLWRDRNQVLPLHGGRCLNCGNIQLPIQRVCAWCQAKDNNEEVRLSDKKATVFTFSMDERAMEVDLPRVWTISDFDGGGRFYCVMTDRDPAKVDIGMRVEMTFRRIHDGAGLHNYFWKCRPIRSQ
jgi:3-hydroxy-3-methylglutaryl CoA synthase